MGFNSGFKGLIFVSEFAVPWLRPCRPPLTAQARVQFWASPRDISSI